MEDKRGQVTILLFFGVLIILLGIIMLILIGTVTINMNNALNQSIEIGQVNLADINEETFGQYYLMIINHADFFGMCIIFGTILGLFLSGYFLRDRFPKIGIIFDILFIFVIFIISLYLSSVYSDLVVALSSADQNFAMNYLDKTSFIMLHLYIYTTVIGVLIMILSHSLIPRKRSEVGVYEGAMIPQ